MPQSKINWIEFMKLRSRIASFLRNGFGKMIVAELINRIAFHSDAKRIVVQPESKNKASCGLLLSCGFVLDMEKEIYVKLIHTRKD